MISVCGIKFTEKGRIYYFNKNDISINKSMNVIVETERGEQLGIVEIENKKIDENN